MTSGLDGVIEAETVLSHVDGEAGRLVIRGHDLGDIAGHMSFESVVERLWSDIVPVPDVGIAAVGDGEDSSVIGQGFGYGRFIVKTVTACVLPIRQ
ncbi:MAG: citrate/2-methylcitrate synthase, partial [Novosphingobium sp.]